MKDTLTIRGEVVCCANSVLVHRSLNRDNLSDSLTNERSGLH
jgi:hypothetical protein